MDLLVGAIIGGITVGALYGLIGFAIVLLYKATGVANFAQGNLGAISAFLTYELFDSKGAPLGVAVLLGVLAAAVIGALGYFLILRPNDDAGHLNITMRTLGMYLLLLAIMNVAWGEGQPFSFPSVLPQTKAFIIAGTTVTWLQVGTLLAATVMAVGFQWMFARTRVGLMLLGLAEKPDVAQLLGVRVRALTAVAWALSAAVTLIVAVLVAPTSLLTSNMMDTYLLFAFTGAIIGGLTNLYGALLGGLIVGMVYVMVSVYFDSERAVLSVFVVLMAMMLVKPSGILGRTHAERF